MQKSKKPKLKIIKKFDGKVIEIRSIAESDLKQPQKLQGFINSLVRERVMILANTIKSRKEEIEWLKSVIKEIKTKKAVKLVAVCSGLVVGQSGVTLRRESENHVGDFGISIRSGYRGVGLGKFLMAEVIKQAKIKLKGLKIIRLSVHQGNIPAFNLYTKMGFKQAALIPKQIQHKGKLIDEIIMLKDL